MGKKLYVGSLPYSVSEGQLTELFSQHGAVESAKVISDKYTNQSKGFGFVEMKSDEDAQKAISALNETQFEGRKIVVNEARPQEDRPRRDSGGGGGRDSRSSNRW
ncbi:MAG: RNA-binding protein [Candidatus Schekmanbacteria bacterium RBG_16_38_11]|uniref:RNA-binding protein n=1 Tax=Candidatus Schekmanbacteria bacterium RBG_16_38_11 TaxID=1817880 RepID=A0A1F7RXV1_9BACT|nr:MAG: RNA-binding protein [Candidatus Schekmanbacteria bacterium RBG_16_38_11]